MPVYTRKAFDKLPDGQKRKAFTITASNIKNALPRIKALKAQIIATLAETNEAKAWEQYKAQAKKIVGEEGFQVISSELIVSFRYARQTAYNAGINALIADQKGLWGVQVRTQEDLRVRPKHRKLDGILRPPDDKIWELLQFPLSFNCRCYRVPVTAAQAKEEGLTYTPEADLPTNIDIFE